MKRRWIHTQEILRQNLIMGCHDGGVTQKEKRVKSTGLPNMVLQGQSGGIGGYL